MVAPTAIPLRSNVKAFSWPQINCYLKKRRKGKLPTGDMMFCLRQRLPGGIWILPGGAWFCLSCPVSTSPWSCLKLYHDGHLHLQINLLPLLSNFVLKINLCGKEGVVSFHTREGWLAEIVTPVSCYTAGQQPGSWWLLGSCPQPLWFTKIVHSSLDALNALLQFPVASKGKALSVPAINTYLKTHTQFLQSPLIPPMT